MSTRYMQMAGLLVGAALTMSALAQDSGQETLAAVETRDPGNYVTDSQLRALYTLVESPAGGETETFAAAGETGGTQTGGAAAGGAASDGTAELQPVPCTGECLEAWPPLIVEAGTEPTGSTALNPELIGTTELEDGTVQVTYNGYPLYYFSGDEAEGDLNGLGVEAFGGTWYAVSSSNGVPLETDSAPAEGGGTGEDSGD